MIHKITKRYRTEFKSNLLFKEIINTINLIARIFTDDAVSCINFLFSENKDNREMSLVYLALLKNILNIFYSINIQDFPEFFEDNLSTWINILKGSLNFQIAFNLNDHHLTNLYIKTKKRAMAGLNLYCRNYSEDIAQYYNQFIPCVWNLIGFVKHEQIYEKLIKEMLDYYKIIFQHNRHQDLDMQSVQYLINNMILAEMRLTAKELDDFEDNPTHFLKVELEEVDMDSSNKNFKKF